MIWLIMMPFTLWAAYSWVSILLSGLFAYLMLGIDEIGVQIEEPFGVLPLGSFCATIERNLRELHYSNPEARFAALPWLVPASPTCSRASGSCDGADMAAGMDGGHVGGCACVCAQRWPAMETSGEKFACSARSLDVAHSGPSGQGLPTTSHCTLS